MEETLSQSNEVKGFSWVCFQPTGLRRPTARVGHTVTVLYANDEQRRRPLLLFLGGADVKSTFNEASLLDVYSRAWINLSVPQELQLPKLGRYEHASALVGEKEIYVFGGATKDGPLSEISCLLVNQEKSVDTAQQQAMPPCPKVTLTASPKVIPSFTHSARTQYGCTCTTELGQFLVFAGAGLGSEPVLDKRVHMYDSILNAWKVLEIAGDMPEARFGHLLVYQPPRALTPTSPARVPAGRLYLHGGMALNDFFGDVYELTFGQSGGEDITATWRRLFPLESPPPSYVPDEGSEVVLDCDQEDLPLPWARAAHGGAILPTGEQEEALSTRLFIFGGLTQTGPVNDACYFCLDSGQWTRIECGGSPPAPRFDFAYCLFASSGLKTVVQSSECEQNEKVKSTPLYYFFIHGGMDLEGNLFDNCMVLQLPRFDES